MVLCLLRACLLPATIKNGEKLQRTTQHNTTQQPTQQKQNTTDSQTHLYSSTTTPHHTALHKNKRKYRGPYKNTHDCREKYLYLMGCLQSKQPPSFQIVRQTSGVTTRRASVSSVSSLPSSPSQTEVSTSEYAANTNGVDLYTGVTASAKKDQDRFITIPELFPNVFFTAVFDGHGQNGAVFAERAAKACARLVQSKMAWLDKIPTSTTPMTALDLQTKATSDFTTIFGEIQHEFKTEYEKEVKGPLEKARKAMEKSEGMSLPMSLPMIGGTTATVVLVVDRFLLVAWVGDSRAVMCHVEGGSPPNITAVDLTEDHNVESNEKERARAVASGGALAGRHIAVDGAEGMLQTLRTLGDVPHHSNDIVSAVPEVRVLELSPIFNPFVVLASDGIWHHRSSTRVCEEMFEKLMSSLEEEEHETKELTCHDLLKVCQIYESDLKGWVKSTDAPGDDIVMSAFTVSGFNWKK